MDGLFVPMCCAQYIRNSFPPFQHQISIFTYDEVNLFLSFRGITYIYQAFYCLFLFVALLIFICFLFFNLFYFLFHLNASLLGTAVDRVSYMAFQELIFVFRHLTFFSVMFIFLILEYLITLSSFMSEAHTFKRPFSSLWSIRLHILSPCLSLVGILPLFLCVTRKPSNPCSLDATIALCQSVGKFQNQSVCTIHK